MKRFIQNFCEGFYDGIKNKDEITKKMERYKYIYKVETCSYVIGRKLEETTELIKKRIDYLVKQINFDIVNNKSNI